MEESVSESPHSPRKRWKITVRQLVIIVVVLVIAAAAGLLFVKMRSRSGDPIPQSVQDQVTFAIPYIAGQPAGYKVNPSTFKADNQVVIYALSKDGQNKVFVSTQGKPDNFNFDDFNLKQLTGSSEFLTPVGQAVIGTYGGRTVVSVVTQKLWILMNTGSGGNVSAKDLRTIAGSLHDAP